MSDLKKPVSVRLPRFGFTYADLLYLSNNPDVLSSVVAILEHDSGDIKDGKTVLRIAKSVRNQLSLL